MHLRAIIGKMKANIVKVFWNSINLLLFRLKHCKVGKKFASKGHVRIINRGSIILGNNVVINSSIMANPLGGNTCTILVALAGAQIKVGDGTGLSNVAIYASESVTIGKDVMIGAGVKIYDNDFHPIDFQKRMQKQEPQAKAVNILDGAFIGAHSIILKGVTIGKNSVVGAGAVVTKSIPDGQIWAGNPARFIRNIDE